MVPKRHIQKLTCQNPATDTTYEGAFGVTNKDTANAINIDTPHVIMSMTIPMTSFAIMQLGS
jgi:CubicO group peptidase (beta-lactamase class C family)